MGGQDSSGIALYLSMLIITSLFIDFARELYLYYIFWLYLSISNLDAIPSHHT